MHRLSVHTELFNKTLWSLGLRVLGVGIGLLAYISLARVMAPAEYGDFLYFVTLVAVVALVLQGGFQTSVLRYAHVYHAQPALWAGFMRTSAFVPLLLAALFAAFAYGLQARGGLPAIMQRVLLETCIASTLFALAYVAQQSLKAFHRIVASQIYEQIGLPLCLAAAALTYWYTGTAMAYADAARVYSVAFLAIVVVTWRLLILHHYPRAVTPQYQLAHWFKSSFLMGLTGIVATLMLRMDVLVMGWLLSSEELAQYGVAARLAALLAFIYAALGNSLSPRISQKYHDGTLHEILPTIRKFTRVAVVLNLTALAVVIALRAPILGLFGPHYAAAGHLLIVLAAAQALNIAAGPLGTILNITRHDRAYLMFMLCFAAILAVALWWGITHYQAVGAAYAVAAVQFAMQLGLMLLVARKTGIRLI
jgi:O-antigen/teichoic acid export membrane protein